MTRSRPSINVRGIVDVLCGVPVPFVVQVPGDVVGASSTCSDSRGNSEERSPRTRVPAAVALPGGDSC